MGNVIGSAAQDFVAMLQSAVTQPGPWSAVALVLVIVAVAAGLKSKLSASWVWIPALALVMYFAVYRWLRLR